MCARLPCRKSGWHSHALLRTTGQEANTSNIVKHRKFPALGNGETASRYDRMARASGIVFRRSSLQRLGGCDVRARLANGSDNQGINGKTWANVYFQFFRNLSRHQIDTRQVAHVAARDRDSERSEVQRKRELASNVNRSDRGTSGLRGSGRAGRAGRVDEGAGSTQKRDQVRLQQAIRLGVPNVSQSDLLFQKTV